MNWRASAKKLLNPESMKNFFFLAAAALFVVALPLTIWALLYTPEKRKIEPVCGEWQSNLQPGTSAVIFSDEGKFYLTLRYATDTSSRGNTFRLRYKDCVHYIDASGRRIDLFYSQAADVLLLTPGGTFRRII